MSDASLLELRNAWKASGDPADEAAFLRARVRQGDLPEWRLRFAALAGHEAAEQALGTRPGLDDPLRVFVRAVLKQARFDLLARTAIAACRPCARRWLSSIGEDPVTAHFQRVDRALREAAEAPPASEEWQTRSRDLLLYVNDVAGSHAGLTPAGNAVVFLGLALGGAQPGLLDWIVRQATEGTSAHTVRNAIAIEVVPWLLHEGDRAT